MAKTHNDRFDELQTEYLRTRDGKHLSRMYRVCVDLAAKYLAKYAAARRINLEIEEMAHDGAVYVIEQYLRKPGFRVKRITAYLHFGCLKVLFRDKEREKREVSWDSRPLHGEESYYAAFPDESGEKARDKVYREGLLFEDPSTGKEVWA